MMGELKENKRLLIVLICLGVVIIGLVIWVITLYVNIDEMGGQTTGEGTTNEEGIYSEMDDIAAMYEEGKTDEALKAFDEKIKASREAGNYDEYLEFLDARFDVLYNDKRCEEAVAYYDVQNIESFGEDFDDYKYAFYNSAATSAELCKNHEKEAFYTEKLNQLENGDEAYIYEEEYEEDT